MNLSEAKIQTALINLQTVTWTALLEAVVPVLGTTIGSSIRHDQNQAISQGRNVFCYRNPNHLWLELEKRFGRKAGVGTVQLFRKLTRIRMDPAERPTDFRKRFNTLLLQWQEVTGNALDPAVELAVLLKLYHPKSTRTW